MTGPIPPQLGDLESLRHLSLAGNELNGEVPPELGDLESLERLSLSSNELTGEVPSDWMDLDSLEWFSWFDNDENDPLCVPEGDAWDDWLGGIDAAHGPRCRSDGAPDLLVSSVDPTEITLVAGGAADSVVFTILNAGDVAADSTTATIRVSGDSTITTDDTAIGDTLAVPGLAASDSTEVRIILNANAGASPGVVYVGMCVEPVSGESDTGNNCSRAVKLTIVSSASADFEVTGDVSPARRLVIKQTREVGR